MGYSRDCAAAVDDDLGDVAAEDEAAAALWLAVIDEIYDDDLVATELALARGSRATPPRFDCECVVRLVKQGYNIARVKVYHPDTDEPLPHRLLYALHHVPSSTRIVLLGLMPRDVNYDPRSTFMQRVLRDYDALGIARLFRGQ